MARLESTCSKGKWCPTLQARHVQEHRRVSRILSTPGDEKTLARGLGRVAHHRPPMRKDTSASSSCRTRAPRSSASRTPGDVAQQERHAARRVPQGARSPVGSGAAALPQAPRLRAAEAARNAATPCPKQPDPRICSGTSGRGLVEHLSAGRAAEAAGFSLTDILKKRKMPALGWCTPASASTPRSVRPLPNVLRAVAVGPSQDREVVCHASAWDIDYTDDIRIKMCIEPTAEDFTTIHHELGHNFCQPQGSAGAVPRQRERRVPRSDRRHHRAVGDAGIPGESGCSTRRPTPRATSAC